MSRIKKAVLLVGSPRGKKSNSTNIGTYLMNLLEAKGIGIETYWFKILLRNDEKINQMIRAIEKADLIVLAVPLYFDCAPYITIQAMEIMVGSGLNSKTNREKRFFPIINSGLPEQNHFSVVLRIYRKFAKEIGFEWAGSFCIGSGEALSGGEGITIEKSGAMGLNVINTLKKISKSLEEQEVYPDDYVGVIPKVFLKGFLKWVGWLMLRLAYSRWKKNARKRRENIKARPYVDKLNKIK